MANCCKFLTGLSCLTHIKRPFRCHIALLIVSGKPHLACQPGPGMAGGPVAAAVLQRAVCCGPVRSGLRTPDSGPRAPDSGLLQAEGRGAGVNQVAAPH